MRRPVLPNSGPSLAAESTSLRHQLFDSSPELAAAFSISLYSSSVTLKLTYLVRLASLIVLFPLSACRVSVLLDQCDRARLNCCKRWAKSRVHALREHSGPRAGCRVTSFRCAAPCFIFSFVVENFRDVRQADDHSCKNTCRDDRRQPVGNCIG